MIEMDTRLYLEFETLCFGMLVFFFLIHPSNRKRNTNHNYSRIWRDFFNILHIPHLCSCRKAVLWLRVTVTSLFLCFSCCAKTGYINEYQTAAETSAALMCSQLTFFLAYFCSSSPTPPQDQVSFRNWWGTLRPNVPFLSQIPVIVSPLFIFFPWLWSPDSSFLPSERKYFF